MDTLDRRSFVSLFSGTSLATTLFPGALWALAQQQNRITKEMVVQAEQLAGLTFTDPERDAMVNGLNGTLRSIDQLRTVDLPNSVAPAIQFEPLVADMKLPTVKRPIRYSTATVQAPKNLEQVAFWPVM